MNPVTSVTKNLAYLCCGQNAGPKKLEKARAQGVTLLTESDFYNLVGTGETPDRVRCEQDFSITGAAHA